MSDIRGRHVDKTSKVVERFSDGELVRQVLEGDLTAFDVLVTRYRPVVLRVSRMLLNDWEQAEDVTQQTLVEAFRCLPGLQDVSKFRTWLMTITRRCALRRRATRGPALVELSEAVMFPLAASTPAEDGVIELVRERMVDLSSRNRQVMTLHYLDGYSCHEVGRQLHLPVGTVKRILHESRNSLRAGIGVWKGDREPMDVVSSTVWKHTGPRGLVCWVNGRWTDSIMGGTLSRSICLAINKTPKTIDQIADDVEAHSQYVQEALNPLVDEGLVVRLDGDRYLDQFIAINAEDWISLTKDAQKHGSLLADAVVPHLPEMEEAWNRTTLPYQGFAWTEGIWPTLAIIVSNVGIARHSPPTPEPPMHPSGYPYWLGCHETVEPEHDVWFTGCNSNMPGDDGLAYAYWWSPGVNRPHYDFHDERDRAFGALGNGAADAQAVAEKSGLSVERTREILAEAIELGLVTREPGKLALAFPIIRKPDDEVLYPIIDAVVEQVTADVLLPCTAETGEQLRAMGYEQQVPPFSVWREWMEINVAGECLRELVMRGILPAIPDPAPTSFCMVGWYPGPNQPRVLSANA